MGVMEIFDACPLDIWRVILRYLVGVLEILNGCFGDIGWVPGDIWWVPGRIWWVSWSYFMNVLEIF